MKTRAVIFIVPLILLALALAGGSELLLRLFFLSLLVMLVSYLWTEVSIRGISVRAEAPPEYCQVGGSFPQEITVFNNSRLPRFWLKLEANTDMVGEPSRQMLNLLPGGSYRWPTTVCCRRRGRYSVGSVLATAVSPFGLFLKRRRLGEPHSVTVYPATVDLPRFNLASAHGSGYGPGGQALSQISPNAATVRDFTTGDSLRYIHWHSTAHTGKLMVKVFDADRSRNGARMVWVVLDMQASAHYGQGEAATEEYGVTIAASVVRKYLESGLRAGLMASGDSAHLFPPAKGEEHLWRILEALALIKATGKVSVSQFISGQMERLGGEAMVVIISPAATGELVDAIRRLRSRVDSVVAVLLDAASFGGGNEAATALPGLSAMGVPAYIVRRGDELTQVLNERFPVRYT